MLIAENAHLLAHTWEVVPDTHTTLFLFSAVVPCCCLRLVVGSLLLFAWLVNRLDLSTDRKPFDHPCTHSRYSSSGSGSWRCACKILLIVPCAVAQSDVAPRRSFIQIQTFKFKKVPCAPSCAL